MSIQVGETSIVVTNSGEPPEIVTVQLGPRHVGMDVLPSGSHLVRVYLEPDAPEGAWAVVKKYVQNVERAIRWVDENLVGPYSVEAGGLLNWTVGFEREEDAVGFASLVADQKLDG